MNRFSIAFSVCMLILFNSITSIISAQMYATAEQIEEVKSRKLLVVQEEMNSNIVKELTKVDASLVDTYKVALKLYNANLKIAIDSFWLMHDEYQLVTINEAKAIEKSKTKEHVIISSSTFSEVGYYFNMGWSTNDIKENLLNYHKLRLTASYGIAITLIEHYEEKYIGFIPANRVLPTKTEMAYMIQGLNMQLSGKKNEKMRTA